MLHVRITPIITATSGKLDHGAKLERRIFLTGSLRGPEFGIRTNDNGLVSTV